MFFRELSEEDAERFRRWARKNYTVGGPIDGVWHPVVQDECVNMNKEAAIFSLDNKEED